MLTLSALNKQSSAQFLSQPLGSAVRSTGEVAKYPKANSRGHPMDHQDSEINSRRLPCNLLRLKKWWQGAKDQLTGRQ